MEKAILGVRPEIKDISTDLPSRSDSQDQFTDKANRFFTSLPEWRQSLSNFGGWIQSTAQQTSDLRDEVEQFKENSEQQVDLAKAEVQNCQAEVEGAKQQADRSLSEADRAQQQADRAEMHRQSAEVAAAAAGSATGLPTLTGKANQVLTVNASGDGVHWRQSGRVGDILETAGSPPPGYLPMNGGEYRAADYPDLARIMPKVWWKSHREFDIDSDKVAYLGNGCWLTYKLQSSNHSAHGSRYYSSDDGASWKRLDQIRPYTRNIMFSSLAFNPITGTIVYQDSLTKNIFSTDRSFTEVREVLKPNKYARLYCNPTCGRGEWAFDKSSFASFDDGRTWKNVSVGNYDEIYPVNGAWITRRGRRLFYGHSIVDYDQHFYESPVNSYFSVFGSFRSKDVYIQVNNVGTLVSHDSGRNFEYVANSLYPIFLTDGGIFVSYSKDNNFSLFNERGLMYKSQSLPIHGPGTSGDFNQSSGTMIYLSHKKLNRLSVSESDPFFYVPVKSSTYSNVYIKAIQ